MPVFASGLGGLPELVEPGRYGEIAPAADPDALAAALDRRLADPARALAMGRAARARAERDLSPERHLERMMCRYARARAAGGAGSAARSHFRAATAAAWAAASASPSGGRSKSARAA